MTNGNFFLLCCHREENAQELLQSGPRLSRANCAYVIFEMATAPRNYPRGASASICSAWERIHVGTHSVCPHSVCPHGEPLKWPLKSTAQISPTSQYHLHAHSPVLRETILATGPRHLATIRPLLLQRRPVPLRFLRRRSLRVLHFLLRVDIVRCHPGRRRELELLR